MKYALIDLSKTLQADELAHYAAAQQRQLREDYASCNDGDGCEDTVTVAATSWHQVAALVAAPTDPLLARVRAELGVDFLSLCHAAAPKGQEDALGFHDLGVLHVFLDLAKQTNTSWTSIMSHETLESRTDTRLHNCFELDDGTIIDAEVCDRVEAESYTIDGVELSNFNTPACFSPPPGWSKLKRTQRPGIFDFLGTSTRPNEVRQGGYSQRLDPDKGWVQIDNGMRAYRKELAARGLSRMSRRRHRAMWGKVLSMTLGGSAITDDIA